MKLVPNKPTDAMVKDGTRTMSKTNSARYTYENMVAYCPTVEVVNIEDIMYPEQIYTGHGDFEVDEAAVSHNNMLRAMIKNGYKIIKSNEVKVTDIPEDSLRCKTTMKFLVET